LQTDAVTESAVGAGDDVFSADDVGGSEDAIGYRAFDYVGETT
jgi:hypothetical protein